MKIIVLGDGLLGSEIIKQSGWHYISRKQNSIYIDEFDSWGDLLLDYDIILNCIAYTNTYDYEKEKHWKVNYKFVSELADFCVRENKKLIHISTDYVYAGSNDEATEEDVPVHHKSWYAYSKLVADAYIELKMNDFLIIRESHKPYPFPFGYAWDDQVVNGDYVTVIAKLIISAIESNLVGIYNVGTELKTWYSLTVDEFKTTPIRSHIDAPKFVTMNINKFKNIN